VVACCLYARIFQIRLVIATITSAKTGSEASQLGDEMGKGQGHEHIVMLHSAIYIYHLPAHIATCEVCTSIYLGQLIN
jgi:hypothetical protein